MSKKKKNRNKFSAIPPFAQIEQKLVDSEGFKHLRAHTKWLYVEFRLRWNGENAKDIILTYQDAKKIMSEDTFIGDRKLLIERGFIDVIKRGGLEKRPMIYGLSNRWKKYGTKDFIKVDIKKILPKIYKNKFKKGHKFKGNQFKKEEHL